MLKAALAVVTGVSLALPARAESPRMKMTTSLPPGIASPDKVETRLGALSFFDGFPDKATVDRLYDNLDFQRAVQAYLLAIPAVSQAANRNEILKLGPANTTVPIFENRMDSKSVFLTPNTQTPYSWMWLDLRDGPLVLEAPPKVLGAINDMWYDAPAAGSRGSSRSTPGGCGRSAGPACRGPRPRSGACRKSAPRPRRSCRPRLPSFPETALPHRPLWPRPGPAPAGPAPRRKPRPRRPRWG